MKKKVVSILMAAVMVIGLTACGGGAANKSGESSATSGGSGSAAASSGPVTAGDGWFDINFTGMSSMSPFRSNAYRPQQYFDMMYEPLAMISNEKKLVGIGASDWSTEDNITYHVNLKETIKDSAGNQITADDVVWFVNTAKEKGLKPVFGKIKEITKTGDYSFDVTLNNAIIGVFEFFMEDTFLISEKAYKESKDEFATELVSTSPYKVTAFTPDGDMKLEKRTDYWQAETDLPKDVRPVVEKIFYHCITEASQIEIALQTGLIDYAIDPAPSIAKNYVSNADYTLDQCPGNEGYQIFFSGHESRAVADNVKLRQAICYAIDNQALIDAVSFGLGTRLYDVCTPFYIGYNPEWEKQDYYEFNLDKAKALVAESGYDGSTLKILCGGIFKRTAEIIQACCAQAGINIEIYSPEQSLLLSIRFDGSQYDMFINQIGGTFMPDHWSIRYDPNAYPTGDGTARHDYVLGDLLYKTWTVEGYTKENIDEVHNYIKDNAIAYGLFNQNLLGIYSNKNLKCTDPVYGFMGCLYFFSSTWEGI